MALREISRILDEMISTNPKLARLKLAKFFGLWRRVVGDVLASKVRVLDISNGVLVLECKDPLWCSELNLMSDKLISKLNELAGEDLVKRILIRRG